MFTKGEAMLREIRIVQGLSQLDIATKINCSKQAISQYETGRRIPSLETMQKLADALDVDLATIVNCFVEDKKEKDQQK